VTGLRECRPGGSCPDCNPKPIWCQGCLEVEIENPGDLCDECEAASIRDFVGDEQTTRDMEAQP
jgi:hypothetical protein